MIKHYITKYEENGNLYAESWLQLNLFGKSYCFSRKKILLETKFGNHTAFFDGDKTIFSYKQKD